MSDFLMIPYLEVIGYSWRFSPSCVSRLGLSPRKHTTLHHLQKQTMTSSPLKL